MGLVFGGECSATSKKMAGRELAPLPEHMETEEDKRSRNDENQQSILTSQLEEMRGKKENYKRAALKEEERIKRLRISEV